MTNVVNDNGLKMAGRNVNLIFQKNKEIYKIKKEIESLALNIEREKISAREFGYSEEEIKELMDVVIFI